jgi:hypothetical protein
MSVKSLNLYDLKELSLQNEGLALIEMLKDIERHRTVMPC